MVVVMMVVVVNNERKVTRCRIGVDEELMLGYCGYDMPSLGVRKDIG